MIRNTRPCLTIAILVFGAISAVTSAAQPGGTPQVRAGDVRIESSGNATLIRQASARGIIDWESFSLGRDQRIEYALPDASSITLNRVTGGSLSRIDGQIASNGQVWLINPSGILIGPTGAISAHGFIASTLEITDTAFLDGRFQFSSRAGVGQVRNQGTIRAIEGGYALLAGAQVESGGLIEARLGEIILASGRTLTIDLAGDRLIGFAIDGPVASGADSPSAISVTGLLKADGGRITLSARAATDVVRGVVNVAGLVEANRVVERDGEIILDAGATGSAVIDGRIATGGVLEKVGAGVMTVSGTLNVDGTLAPGPGRTIFGSGAGFGSPQTAVSTTTSTVLDLSADGLSDGRIVLGPLTGSGTVLLGRNRLDLHVGDASSTFSGSLKGAGASLYKYGDGLLTLTGLSDYSGGTWIVEGRLRVGGPYRSARPGTPGPVGTGLVQADTSDDARRAWERALARELALAEERSARAAEALAAQQAAEPKPLILVEQADEALSASQWVSQQVAGNATVALATPTPPAPAASPTTNPDTGNVAAPQGSPTAAPAPGAPTAAPAPSSPSASAPAPAQPASSSASAGGSTSGGGASTAAPPSAPASSASPPPSPGAPVQASAPPVAAPPPSPVPVEKPPTPRDSADTGDRTLQAAAPSPPPQPASRPVRVSVQTVTVSPGLVATQVPVPPRPPAGAALDQRLPGTGNSARW